MTVPATLQNTNSTRLLIFRIGYLGDTIIALPALHSVRRNFPYAHLTLLYSRQSSDEHRVFPPDILPASLVDDYISYGSDLSGFRTSASVLRTAHLIRSRRYEAVVYLAPQFRSAKQVSRDRQLFRWLGIPTVLGDGLENQSSTPEFDRVPHHEADFLLMRLASSGIETSASAHNMELGFTIAEKQAADYFLESLALKRTEPLIAVAPTAAQSHKVWSLDRFAEALRIVMRNFRMYPIVIAASHERPIAEELVGMLGRGTALAGQLSVRQTGALLNRCDLLLGNDTGGVHLAAASGTTCVVVKGTNDPLGTWDPCGHGHRVLRGATIAPEDVAAACLEVLTSLPSR